MTSSPRQLRPTAPPEAEQGAPGAKVLVTGGAGFFGAILREELLSRGFSCVSIDLERDEMVHPGLVSVRGDIRDASLLERLSGEHDFAAVFHLAAVLAHGVKDDAFLWSCNVEGTRAVAEMARKSRIPKVIFTSSNCLWGRGMGRPITEEDRPEPVEMYGRSKWEGEKILLSCGEWFRTVIFRCPTIVDSGRLGLLSILFEFIDEGRRLWAVDGGRNRYQFIAARDLADACIRGLGAPAEGIYNIGSDNVPTLAEAYRYVIDRAGSKSRVAAVPGRLALPLMKAAFRLGISPLGPYQYGMIAEDFLFDTSRIKKELGWEPTLTNGEMLYEAYRYYREHREEIRGREDASPHRKAAGMGIIRLLKWLS